MMAHQVRSALPRILVDMSQSIQLSLEVYSIAYGLLGYTYPNCREGHDEDVLEGSLALNIKMGFCRCNKKTAVENGHHNHKHKLTAPVCSTSFLRSNTSPGLDSHTGFVNSEVLPLSSLLPLFPTLASYPSRRTDPTLLSPRPCPVSCLTRVQSWRKST